MSTSNVYLFFVGLVIQIQQRLGGLGWLLLGSLGRGVRGVRGEPPLVQPPQRHRGQQEEAGAEQQAAGPGQGQSQSVAGVLNLDIDTITTINYDKYTIFGA